MKNFALIFALSFSSMAFALVNTPEADLKEELFIATSKDHKVLGYKKARVVMFNNLDIQKDDKGLFNKDVYCLVKYYRLQSEDLSTDVLPDHNIVNTEHTWPQSKFSDEFNEEMQKSDLHHLYPTGNKINSQRGNFPFGNVVSTKKTVCAEGKLVNPVGGLSMDMFFEPMDEHKGNVARSIFYFSIRYKMPVDNLQETFLKFWNLLDSVDAAEKTRHEGIVKAQGNRNPFIDRPELILKIADF
jgi:endonuclease I